MSKKPLLLIIGLAGIFLLGCFLMSGCGGGGGDSSVGGPPAEPPTDQEVEEITDEQAQEILDTLSDGDSYYNDLVGQGDPSALQKTVDWLKTQPNIEDAAVGEDCVSICIKYDSGVEGIILTESFRSLGEIEAFQAGSEQYLQLKNDLSSTSTTNKKALILLPIDSVPEYKDESVDEIEAYLQQSGFSVEIYRDEDVTVDLMKTVSNYPFVYMATHGCVGLIGSEVMTGEVANTNTIALFWNLLKAGRTSGLTIVMPAETDKIYFGLNENFFDDYVYPSTFVYMNACNSFKNDSLADAFLNNGASVYIGWDNTSFLALSNSHNPEFFQELLKQNNTLMQAYNDTIANYYPAIVYKDDNDNGEYHVLLLNGQHAGDEDDTTVDYPLALKYKGNSEYVLHGPDTLYLNSSLNDQEFTDGQTTKYYSFTLNDQSSVAFLSAGSVDLRGILRDSNNEVIDTSNSYRDVGTCTCSDDGITQTPSGQEQRHFMLRGQNLSAGSYVVEVMPENNQVDISGSFSIVLLKKPSSSDEFFAGLQALLNDNDDSNDYLDIYVKALYSEYYTGDDANGSITGDVTTPDNYKNTGTNYTGTFCFGGVCRERQCKALTNFYAKYIVGDDFLRTDCEIDNNLASNDPDFVLMGAATTMYNSFADSVHGDIDDAQKGDVWVKGFNLVCNGKVRDPNTYNHYGLYISNDRKIIDANWSSDGKLITIKDENRINYSTPDDGWKVVRPSATSPLSDPTGLTATAVSSSQIDLSWDASTDDVGVAGYKIYRDGVYLKSVTTSFASDTGLNPSTEYCYTVSAYDAAGNESGQSSGACATTSSLTNTPPTATITSPSDSDGDTFTEGDEIIFTGTGTDPEDGELSGDYLVWSSDNDGEIGTGTSFTISALSVNTHTITLTATDHDGAADTDTVTITITTSYPYPWTQAIVDKYLELGGSDGVLGSPISDEQTGDSSFTGTICTYINFENGTIEYHTNGNYEGQVFTIINPLFEKWASLGYGTSDLGYPISDISDIETSIYGTQFQYQNFEGGSLEYHLSGGYAGQVFEIHGEIFNKWKSMGYAQSVLGLVTSDEREATQSGAEGFSTTGRVSDFEGGHIHWHRDGTYADQAFESHGDIDELYVSMGGTGSWLGFPTSDEYPFSEGARSDFEGGYIYWNEAEGATAVPTAPAPEIETLIDELSCPTALAIDSYDIELYCVFYGAPALTTIDTTTGEKKFGIPMLGPPQSPLVNDIDISYDDRYLYISDWNYDQIIIMEIEGEGETNTISGIHSPTGVAVDHKGEHLYVTDISTHSIYDIDLTSSEISLLAGSGTAGHSDGVGTDASFNTPVGITIDPTDTRLYLAEPGNNRIREIEITSKNVATLAGSGFKETTDGIGTVASFNDPTYITINREGTKLYVVEFDGATVREINIDTKEVSTLIDQTIGLNQPRDIVISHDDSTLYLADYGNDRILEILLTSNNRPTTTITNPEDGATITQGDEITFTGTGTDPEDGELTGESLVWTSDKDGQIGTGQSLAISTLSVNTHTITLTATDYDGSIGTNSITITVSSSAVAESPWPMFQHDVQHTGLSAYTGTATGTPTSTPKWTVSLSNGDPTSPVIGSEGSIYIGTASGKLYKVNPAGSVNLFYDTQTNGTIQTPALASDDTIYIIDNYSLYALSSNGQLKWKYPFGDGTDGPSPPVIGSNGTIYIGSKYYLYALNPNGELIWQSPMLSNGRWVKSPVLAADGTIYTVGKVGSCDGCGIVYALDPQDGSIIWQTDSGPFNTALSLSSQGVIFVGGNLTLGTSGLFALDSSDGSQKWYAHIGDISGSTPAIGSNGIIYVGQDYLLYALDSEGNSQWPYATVNTQDKIIASPIIDAAGTIYIGSNSKMFYAINPNGTVKWQAELSDKIQYGAVIGSDGTVYVASYDGNLYAFRE